ncbi:hypothetical protein [uncultured Cloacibacillus sp.]|mgnify:CR=1 FL=1|uniref:hypothetical protein n=1 Tax=uncultured Cloacibacillus sp. TaxID=889794 RepID=UPI0026392277|nr:hypothetical protein [uncultured Cloacibacillus sp.]
MRIVTGNFGEDLKYIGKVVKVDGERAYVISAEQDQAKAGRIQRRSFLVVPGEAEAFLLRAVNAKSMYCDNDVHGDAALIECEILGAFREGGSTVGFYSIDETPTGLLIRNVYKPVGAALDEIVNFDVPSSPASYHGIKAGSLKYTASSGLAQHDIEVYINHTDPLGCATAVLGCKDITMPDDIITTLIRAAAESGTSMRACSEENTPQIGQIVFDFGRNYIHIAREYPEITRCYVDSIAKELSENDIQEIIGLARRGYIAIVDVFSLDSDERRRLAAARICEAVYESSSQRMRDGLTNNYIQIYLTKYAQDFIGDGRSAPSGRIYNKIAEDGEKLNIGLVYATDIPSLIAPTMIAETKNFFVSISRLMHSDERDAVKRLKGFEDLADSVRYDPRADHLYMLTRSRPFVVPVQTA